MVTPLTEIEPDTLERIVREVTRRLRESPMVTLIPADPASSVRSGETEVAAAVSPKGTPPKEGVVRLSAPVVTMAEVAGRLKGAREVVIGPRAILTPAVRDVLTQQRIAVTRTAAEARACAGQPVLLVAECATTGHKPDCYWQQLERLGMGVRQVSGFSLIDILREMATKLTGGAHQAVLLTDQTAAALCLANRQPGLRAILATGVDAVRHDTQAVGANLLVVSPRGLTAYQVGNLAREFCHQGVLSCPEKYREWLA